MTTVEPSPVEQRHWIPVDNAVLACRPSVDARLDDPELLSIYAARGSMALTIICERCQGGRRAVLGRVFASPAGPIVAIEVCLPPSATRVVTRREALCDHVVPVAVVPLVVGAAISGGGARLVGAAAATMRP